MSILRSANTFTVSGWLGFGALPALATSIRSPAARSSNASAIWDRALLPRVPQLHPRHTSATALLPWFVLAGIGIGCVETAEHTAVAIHAPEHLRGSAFGLLTATQSFGNLAASAVAVILWTALSPTWAFAYLATAMAVSLVALQRRTRTTADP